MTPPPPSSSAAASRQDDAPEGFHGVAALLALVLPGLGHIVLGEKRRGVLIFAGVMGMFACGMLIGGIDVVDRREDFVWFIGESLVGPVAFGVDYLHQSRFKGIDTGTGSVRSAGPDEYIGPGRRLLPAGAGRGPPSIKSVGRVNELGTLLCTIAGMMNLIVIIDAAFHRARPPAAVRAGDVKLVRVPGAGAGAGA